MLLETFTRRKPNDFEADVSLKRRVSYSLPEPVMDVVDANLLTSTGNRLQKELEVVASIMKVALDCCVEYPARRTNMKDVVGMLQKTKIQSLGCGAFGIKKKDGTVKLKGRKEGRKGELAIDTEIFEITPAFHVVEVKKKSGDTAEYRKFCDQGLTPSLKDLFWTWQGNEQQHVENQEIKT
ncbi:CBL-interacting protein kinase 18 [Capsicum chinense]|nr:CBL-interacting protein kinase 18 [Capsicum chinense]